MTSWIDEEVAALVGQTFGQVTCEKSGIRVALRMPDGRYCWIQKPFLYGPFDEKYGEAWHDDRLLLWNCSRETAKAFLAVLEVHAPHLFNTEGHRWVWEREEEMKVIAAEMREIIAQISAAVQDGRLSPDNIPGKHPKWDIKGDLQQWEWARAYDEGLYAFRFHWNKEQTAIITHYTEAKPGQFRYFPVLVSGKYCRLVQSPANHPAVGEWWWCEVTVRASRSTDLVDPIGPIQHDWKTGPTLSKLGRGVGWQSSTYDPCYVRHFMSELRERAAYLRSFAESHGVVR